MAAGRLSQVLAGSRYPGRGVVWARTRGGTLAGAYFLTGRSSASKARALMLAGAELTVSPLAGSQPDPLRHYVAARQSQDWLVFGNGDQVSLVAERLAAGLAPSVALSDIEYEPDPPLYTPRITVVAGLPPGDGSAWLGAACRSRAGRSTANVRLLSVGGLAPGDGVLMTTYSSEGDIVDASARAGEVSVAADSADGLLSEVWSALDPDYRVAAAAFELGRLTEAVVRS